MISLKRITSLCLLCFVLALVAFSCEKEDFQPTENPVVNVEPRMAAVLGKSLSQDPDNQDPQADSTGLCFTFNFPLSFLLEDGTTLTINSEEDEIAGDVLIADFAYPLTITLADGSDSEINDIEGFITLLTECYGDFEDWEDGEWDNGHGDCPLEFDSTGAFCFDFVYPFSVTDGTSETVIADEEAFGAFVSTLDSTNAENYDFVYPFDVTLLEEGSTATITSEEDFNALLESCYDFGGGYGGQDGDCPIDVDPEEVVCFDFVYPFSVTDGTSETVITDEEAFFNYLETLDSTNAENYDFVYPFDVSLLADGSVQTITSEEDFEALLESCFDFEGGWGGEGHGDCPIDVDVSGMCFDFVYPFSITDGTTETVIADEAAFIAYLETLDSTNAENYDFVYPFDVSLLADGSIQTITSEEDFEALLESCFDFGGGFDPLADCFSVNYPISILVHNPDGETQTVVLENDEALNHLISGGNEAGLPFNFVYPFNVTLQANGENVTINNEADLGAVLEACDE